MSIYRWAKLDDQSGPDRSIELKLELPVKELVVGDSTFARPHVSFEVAGNLHYLGDTAITKFPQHGLCLADLLHAAVDINLNHLGFQRAFRTDHCCPVRSPIDSTGCRGRVSRCRSRRPEVSVKWAFSRRA